METTRKLVLVEEPDAAEAFAYWRLLEGNGYRVAWCPGPEVPPGRSCPLVAGGHCKLVEQADVVVSSLGLQHESSRRILEALKCLHSEKPVIVQGPRPLLERYEALLGGRAVLRMPVNACTVVASVRECLDASS